MKGTGFCGINCHTCPIYQATVEDKPEERAKLAREWNKTHQTTYKASQMICPGVSPTALSPIAMNARYECSIRRGLKTAAGVSSFLARSGRVLNDAGRV